MSNVLIKLANQIVSVTDAGVPRRPRPSERSVLSILADDAREHRGGRSDLGPAAIAKRSSLSIRAIRYALRVLVESGHISREAGEIGEVSTTMVHPIVPAKRGLSPNPVLQASGADFAPVARTVCTPGVQPLHGSKEVSVPETNHHSPQAGAREAGLSGFRGPVPEPVPVAPEPRPPSPPPAGRQLEPVDQVFAHWDAWRDRAGLPGPVTRNPARRVGVARAIEAQGLGKVLMSIDTIERGFKAGRFRRKNAVGQDDLWATFDALFDVGHARELNLLARLLDGEFGAVVPAAAPAARESQATDPDEPDPVQNLRNRIRARIGEAAARQWIDPLRFDWRGDELLAITSSAFVADWVATNYAGELRGAAGGAPVRVVVEASA
jgi:hypothetical protein